MEKIRHDFDSPWKDILHRYFREFMEFFFPDAHDDIDWGREHEFLDKEFQQAVRDAELGTRFLDKLVKVWRKDGKESWVLAHIEVQGDKEQNFSKRIFTYNYRIFDRFNQPAVSLVVLADDNPGWRPCGYTFDQWNCRGGLEFPSVKLLDFGAERESLERNRNPFSIVVMAHLQTLATKKDRETRLQGKLRLVRMLYGRGYAKQDVIELFRFIDWVMILPPEDELRFGEAVSKYEEENRMPYVTSVERIGMERGIAQGIAQGEIRTARRAILDFLEARFQCPPPAEVVDLVNEIQDSSLLMSLFKEVAIVSSSYEFKRIVEERISSN